MEKHKPRINPHIWLLLGLLCRCALALLGYILSISLVLGGIAAFLAGIIALINQEIIPERFRKWSRYPVVLIAGGIVSLIVGVVMFSALADT